MKLQMVITGLGALAIGAAALAPQAHADESSFLTDVGNAGLPVDATTLAIGHQICYDISANGVAGVDNEARMAHNAGVTADDFATLVVESVYELCPSNLPAMRAWEHS